MAMREARSRSMERSPLRELVAARASCDSTTMTASLGLGLVLTMVKILPAFGRSSSLGLSRLYVE